ncbi:hypothetical protein [uncultured Chryseobacterium sp.]|uniref:hypothetical protein n=1 Tax=uncultured Chryseobacterium sp. TaxID=259322 RepID=UPI0025FFC752|nr:hypothetical protein [uncultured Chryseobacterium sp.]
MLTEIEIIKIAKDYVKKQSERSGYDLVILDNAEIKKPYGIIFRYNTKKFNQTRDYNDKTLIGNTPFLVENKNGKIIIFGSSQGLDYYVEEYEAGRWPDMPRLSDFQ